jgi:hypothetical protein
MTAETKVSRLKHKEPDNPAQRSWPEDDDDDGWMECVKCCEAEKVLKNAKQQLDDVLGLFRSPILACRSATATRADMHGLAGAVAAVNRTWDELKAAFVESLDDPRTPE